VTDKTPAESSAPKRIAAAKAPPAVPKMSPTAKKPAAKPPVSKPPVSKPPVVAETPTVISPAATAPAGWYPEAVGSPQQRWWDGSQWTRHVYNGAAGSLARPPIPVVPEGTNPGTVWFWLLAYGIPVLQILDLIPASLFFSQLVAYSEDPGSLVGAILSPAYLVLALSGWFISAVCIVFAVLDWRELRHRGIPKPFHWGWSFFVLVVGWPVVYMIGRTVVAKGRTGTGTAPLWAYLALQVVAFIAISIVAVVAFAQFLAFIGSSMTDTGTLS
jgi:hypothetical protein